MYEIIIGVDETGRGAIAGPLVIGAAAFPREMKPLHVTYQGARKEVTVRVNDSKKVASAGHREALDRGIRDTALAYAVISKSPREIDAMTLGLAYQDALLLAVSRVLEQLATQETFRDQESMIQRTLVLFDGMIKIPAGIPCATKAIAKADELYWQVSAASILAKVYRDQRMRELALKYPSYDLDENNGYPTKDHKAILRRLGESPVHRRTYAPVRALRAPTAGVED